jgi:hypothetical protein
MVNELHQYRIVEHEFYCRVDQFLVKLYLPSDRTPN